MDQLVNFEFGADVDAAGGLVEQYEPRLRHQRLAEHDFLLVAAGQAADARLQAGRLDPERREEMPVADVFRGAIDATRGTREPAQTRERQVEAHLLRQHESVAAPVFAREHDAASNRFARRRMRVGLAMDRHVAVHAMAPGAEEVH